jgi:undecaprenyl diphosphate synthase
LDPGRIPAHVAIIMDGNGRWAQKRLMNRVRGHEQGAQSVRAIVAASRRIGIQVLTLYAFSTENWARPQVEISALMELLKDFLVSEQQTMMEKNIRLNAIGEIGKLPERVQAVLEETMRLTRQNDGMLLNLALSYGGRSEILRMVQTLTRKATQGTIMPEMITEKMIADHLYTADMPDPDLLIRTSGEMRISNFLLWQIAYSEIFVTPTLWPDFNEKEYLEILKEFQNRERRFGKLKDS